MDINPEDETSSTTQYQEALSKYVENKHCTKPRCLPVAEPERILNNNPVSSAMASRSRQSSHDPYDLSSNDEDYLMPNNVAETTPRQSDHAAHLLTAVGPYLIPPTELPQN